MKLELEMKDGCDHCKPKLKELQEIQAAFDDGRLPRDLKLTLELNSDWLGEHVWHLNEVTVKERKR